MSLMAQECSEAPEAVARFLNVNGKALQELGARLRRHPPPVLVTSARGSSDHAALYFKYLSEILLGVPCCSLGSSVVSVYGATLKLEGAVALTVSQSGKSPDIVAVQKAASEGGAFTVALVNDETSPAALAADLLLPLSAGPEISVAATKSFIVSMVAAAAIIANWRDDARLFAAIEDLPNVLRRANDIAWPEFEQMAVAANSLYVLGRGPGFPLALETALKLKETCAIHAEAHSLAEVMHGPLELLDEGFPVLAYSPEDQSRSAAKEALTRIRTAGGPLLVVEQGGLPYAQTAHPLLDPISMMLTGYRAIERVAQALGRDPDKPRLLKKVTETL